MGFETFDLMENSLLTVSRPDFKYEYSDLKKEDYSKKDVENMVKEHLQQIYDPEIPINIWELGLVYNIYIDDDFNCNITMTLTTPNCPTAETLPEMVKVGVECIPIVNNSCVELSFDPPWGIDFMSEDSKMLLGLV